MHHSEILIALSRDNLPKQTGVEYLRECFRQDIGGDEVPIKHVAKQIRYLLAAGIIQGDDQHYQFTPKWLDMVEVDQYQWFNTKYRSQKVSLVGEDFDRNQDSEVVYVLTCQTTYPYFASTLLAIKLTVKEWLANSPNGPIALAELEGEFSLANIEDYADGHFYGLLASYGVIDLVIEVIPLAWHPADSSFHLPQT